VERLESASDCCHAAAEENSDCGKTICSFAAGYDCAMQTGCDDLCFYDRRSRFCENREAAGRVQHRGIGPLHHDAVHCHSEIYQTDAGVLDHHDFCLRGDPNDWK
jgi:hypothetical protein